MIEYNIDWKEEFEGRDKSIEEAFYHLVEEKESGKSGYYLLPESSSLIIEEVKATLLPTPIIKDATTIVVVGIGGSSLGAKAMDQILRPISPNAKRLLFFENPDPLEFLDKVETITKEETIFIIISKSGSTIETTSLYKLLIKTLNIDIEKKDKDRIFIITDKESILHQYAQKYNLKTFFIPKNVGGRFSVLSAVGIVPLTLAGYDTMALLRGAKRLEDSFFSRKAEHILHKGVLYVRHHKEWSMNILFAYSSYFRSFSEWYVQLWGESLGKINTKGQRVGLTPLGHIGSIDQHSFLQLLMEGPKDKSVSFLQIKNFPKDINIPSISLNHIEKNDYINGESLGTLLNAECESTWEALKSEGVPTDRIILDTLSSENIGELVFYYELLTSVIGTLLDIDTYNQPGVELGKKILRKKFD